MNGYGEPFHSFIGYRWQDDEAMKDLKLTKHLQTTEALILRLEMVSASAHGGWIHTECTWCYETSAMILLILCMDVNFTMLNKINMWKRLNDALMITASVFPRNIVLINQHRNGYRQCLSSTGRMESVARIQSDAITSQLCQPLWIFNIFLHGNSWDFIGLDALDFSPSFWGWGRGDRPH